MCQTVFLAHNIRMIIPMLFIYYNNPMMCQSLAIIVCIIIQIIFISYIYYNNPRCVKQSLAFVTLWGHTTRGSLPKLAPLRSNIRPLGTHSTITAICSPGHWGRLQTNINKTKYKTNINKMIRGERRFQLKKYMHL